MPDVLTIQLCGAPQFSWNGVAPIHLPGGKSMALLVYLVATRQPHTRDQLANLLWSEMANQRARDNLRYVLPDLRKELAEYLLVSTQAVRFNDALSYQLDIETIRTTLSHAPTTLTTQALTSTLDLYHDAFLAGFNVRNAPVFEEWVTVQRNELETLVLQGLQQLAERYLAEGEMMAGQTTTQRLLTLDPWHEAGHRLQMQFLIAGGQRGAAIEQYHHMRQRLKEEVGIEPAEATQRLYAQLVRDEVTVKPTLQSVSSTPSPSVGNITTAMLPVDDATASNHNLPGQLTPFLGRQSEVTELRSLLLSPQNRLITLVGEGGIGKTRLALAVAQSIIASTPSRSSTPMSALPLEQSAKVAFPNGVWFIALSDIKEGSGLADSFASAVAQPMRVQFSGNQPLLAQLLAELRNKTLLLIFDNAEHLVPGVTECLIQLLQRCHHLTVLVTSRSILNLQTEFIWRIEGLSIPAATELHKLTMAQISTYSSVALFIERAKRVHREFQLTAENRDAVVNICHLVEGLPLAIELAAALVTQHTCSELAAALQDDYQLLATTFTDLPPRHRSIQAVLDYSWRYLKPDEAYTLSICSVFTGGFDSVAAAAIVGARPELLAKLVDQSLLQLHERRYVMHELVRKYAAAQLSRRPGERRAALIHHATYYMAYLQEVKTTLLVEFAAQAIVERELGNIRAAWHWIVTEGNPLLLAPGAAALQSYYRLTGLYHEAIQTLRAAITAVRRATKEVVRAAVADSLLRLQAELLCYITQFYRRTGSLETGVQVASEALHLGQQLADPSVQGLAYHELARLAQVSGDYPAMQVLTQQGLTQACAANLPHLTAECLNDLGIAVGANSEPLAGMPYFQAALDRLHDVTNHYLRAFILTNLGRAYLVTHEYQSAWEHLQHALALQHHLHDRAGSVATLIHLCNLWLVLGQWTEAQQCYTEAYTILQSLSDPYWESRLYICSGYLHYFQDDPAHAQDAFVQAQKIAHSAGLSIQEQWADIGLGHALIELGDYDAAGHCYQHAITLENSLNGYYHTAEAHAGLATTYFIQGRGADAADEAEAALTAIAERGLIAAAAPITVYWRCLYILKHRDPSRAHEVLHTAYQTLQKIAHKLDRESLRHSFLENVAVNRRLIAAAQSAGLTSDSFSVA